MIPIRGKIVFPNLICDKMIKLKRLTMPVLALYLKNKKKQDFRITFKNNSEYLCYGELSVLKNPQMYEFLEVKFYPD